MTRASSFTVQNAILCEDIRQERSNKFILIGVFSGNIILNQMPSPIRLAIYIQGQSKAREGEIWVRISGPGDGSAKFKLVYERGEGSDLVVLVTPGMEILMERPGIFKAEFSEDNSNWAPLFERPVELDANLKSMIEIHEINEEESDHTPNE